MYSIGDVVELKIEKMVYEGFGLSHLDNFVFFADGVCDGDVVRARITKLKKNYANVCVEEIIEPSIYRVEPFCPIYNACGGCQWQHIDYNHQIKLKQEIVKDILSKSLGYDVPVSDTMPSPSIKEFRYKVQMPVSQTKNSKRFLIGYYKKGSHEIINNKFCPIQPQIVNSLLNEIRNYAHEIELAAYNENSHKGEIRHILFRISKHNGKVLLCFVVNNTKVSEKIRMLSEFIYNQYEEVIGVSVNFNISKSNIILGNETKNIIGKSAYIEKIDNVSYLISPESFFQVNPDSFKNILKTVKNLIVKYADNKKVSILDAYSGVGSFGLYLSDIADKITCVEEIKSACDNAKTACENNNINNIDIVNGDAQEVFKNFINSNKKFDFVILDPPRKGCTQEALDCCAKMTNKYIIYVSCNPNSLARDLKYLQKLGFELKYAQTADMFCHTYHVETVTFIEKKHNLK